MTKVPEADIIKMLREPTTREKGFRVLMDTYKVQVYWHIRRLVGSHDDAEDILQETFINAFRFFGSFNGNSRLFTWIYRIATNECIRHDKKKRNKKFIKTGITPCLINEMVSQEIENKEDILIKFQEAILQLPEKQRIVFNLRYYDELSYEDIREITGSNINALKTNYHYASEKIKEYLKNI